MTHTSGFRRGGWICRHTLGRWEVWAPQLDPGGDRPTRQFAIKKDAIEFIDLQTGHVVQRRGPRPQSAEREQQAAFKQQALLEQFLTEEAYQVRPKAPNQTATLRAKRRRRDSLGHPFDTQRKKLYRAERSIPGFPGWFEGDNLTSAAIAKALVDAVVARLFEAKLLTGAQLERALSIRVKFTGGQGGARAYYGMNQITMSRGARNHFILMHELAHLLNFHGKYERLGITTAWRDRAGHGWEFCRLHLQTMEACCGSEKRDQLLNAYNHFGVEW